MRPWVLLFVGACGSAEIGDGSIQCSVSGDCPTGFVCRADRCYRRSSADAAVFGDGAGCEEGAACAPPGCAAWGDCEGFLDDCDQDGTQARTCRVSICTQGACTAHDEPEIQVCTRDTSGQTCGSTTCGAWDHDDFDCSPGCDDERTCTAYACREGICEPSDRVETGFCASNERCGSYSCSCGTFDLVCDAAASCLAPESCASLCI